MSEVGVIIVATLAMFVTVYLFLQWGRHIVVTGFAAQH